METLEGSNIEPLLTTAGAFPSLPLSMVCIECNSVVAGRDDGAGGGRAGCHARTNADLTKIRDTCLLSITK